MISFLDIFILVVIIYSAIIHEYMHGWMADRLGDPTARYSGRLTLNPLSHIDPVGSILLPLILIFTKAGFIFGYAKPVPYNPYNLRDQKYGSAKVAFAGPLANIITAVFFGLLLRAAFYFGYFGQAADFNQSLPAAMLAYIVFINLILAVFNLIPIPPLDGSKILAPFLPFNWQAKFAAMESYGLIVVFIFVMVGFMAILPVINMLYYAIVGINFY